MAGAFTESTVIGTASDTIDRLDLPEAEKTQAEEQHPGGLCGQLPGRHGIRRLVSVGRGSPSASRQPEGGEPETGGSGVGGRRSLGRGRSPGLQGMEHPCATGWPTPRRAGPSADLERSASPERVFVERIRRGAELHRWPRRRPCCNRAMSSPSRRGGGCCSVEACRFGEEVEDPALLDFPMATLDVVVTKRECGGATALRPGPAARARRRPRRS